MSNSRSSVFAVALAATLVVPSVAWSQTFGYDMRAPRESPQNFAIEVRVGGYIPRVDDEFGGARTPFGDMFGNAIRVLPQLEFDWQIVRLGPVVNLGIGASVGFTSIAGLVPFTADMPGGPDTWRRSTVEYTNLSILPTTLVAVARFDGLMRRVWWFPLVPYVKGGLAYNFWWVTNGRGTAYEYVTGSDGMQVRSDAWGTAFGFHGAAGLALNLGVFEPRVQREFDTSSGVNRSYLFFEIYGTWMGGIRQQLNLSTLAWSAGLTLEF